MKKRYQVARGDTDLSVFPAIDKHQFTVHFLHFNNFSAM